MEIELEDTRTSHTIPESALRALQRDIPQVPSPRWKTFFRLSRIYQTSHKTLKASKGKEKERVTENGLALVPNQQQPQDRQHSRANFIQEEQLRSSPRELLSAALKMPVRYPSGFSVLRAESVPHDQRWQDFYAEHHGVQQQLIETLIRILGIAAACNSRVEYVMGRINDAAQLKPTILICCKDKDQCRKVDDYFKGQSWTIMKGFSYSVEVDPVVLASGSVDLERLRGNAVRARDLRSHETLCGVACEVFEEKDMGDPTSLNSSHPLARLTLGGLICVDNRSLYALTTAHSFIEASNSDSTASTTTKESDYVLSGKMYQFGYPDRLPSPGPEKKSPRKNWAWDWALLRIDQPAYYKPNSFQPQPSKIPRVFIESHLTAEELCDGKVWVCSASKGPRLAMLYADRTLMTIGNSTFEARSIGLAEELADGDSGSWVVRDGKLCGYIFSRTLHSPWAYMLSIGPVFQEISRVLSHKSDQDVSVEVATRADVGVVRSTALKPEIPKGTTGDNNLPPDPKAISPSFSELFPFSPQGQDKNDSEKIADIAGKFDLWIALPRLIQLLVAPIDSFQITDWTKEPSVTEKARQLHQRVEMHNIVCLDLLRNLVTTYSNVEDLNDGELLHAATELITEKLIRDLGMRKTKFVFEIFASILNRLWSLHNSAESIGRSFKKNAFVRMFHGFKLMIETDKIEKLLDGLEMSNDQLHRLLFDPALRQSVQQRHVKILPGSELQLELYGALSLVFSYFDSIDPVVGLTLSYPTIEDISIMSQDSSQQLSLLCHPRRMSYGWENQLRNVLSDNNENTPWKVPSRWVRGIAGLDMTRWRRCEIQQKGGSRLMERESELNTFAQMLGDTELSVPKSTTVNFLNSIHHMVLDIIGVSPERTLMNMAKFLENEQGERSYYPTRASSSYFIEFAYKLSYSILTLSSTPWVRANWTWDNVLVMLDTEKDDEELEVVILHKLESANESIEEALRPTHSKSEKLEEPILTRLGFALTELALRRRLEASDDRLIYKTAINLSDTGQIAVRAGQIYGDVVKACLTHLYRSGSEIKTLNSSSPDFQDAVHEAVLSPLHAVWSSMRKARKLRSTIRPAQEGVAIELDTIARLEMPSLGFPVSVQASKTQKQPGV